MPTAGCKMFTRDFSLSLNVTCLKKGSMSEKNLEASILYLSCGWRTQMTRLSACQFYKFKRNFNWVKLKMSSFVKASLRLYFQNEFCTLAKTQLHAQLHRQIHGNIFIRVIYSKQVQLETEKIFPPCSYVTNRTTNGIIENVERQKLFAGSHCQSVS